MSLEIVNGGALTTVQDLGRFGYMNKGFQVSGAVDDQVWQIFWWEMTRRKRFWKQRSWDLRSGLLLRQ